MQERRLGAPKGKLLLRGTNSTPVFAFALPNNPRLVFHMNES